ncbi:cyclophilin-like fold protein [Geobacillus sp. BMUD]|uniref:cyclophilin-like fold protein n=1 Tax=Geobacillus sp. BMUD TaxID=2508876 RepID=UPI001C0EAEEE|nr:cyclophilin-like fold protein [Geobacillus sp. BMUD]
MSKLLSATFSLTLIFAVAACGGNQSGNSAFDEAETVENPSTNDKRDVSIAGQEENRGHSAAKRGQDAPDEDNSIENTKIRLIFDHGEVIVNMYDNPTSRDLLSRLPLTLTFEDFSGFEKMSILEEGLSTEGAPEGVTPKAGDFAYYAPWKDITIFYDDWRYSPGLIRLGKVESDVEELSSKLASMKDDFTVTIEKVE